ncbi:rhombosortase [Vibrio sp. HN007]|uniref:rhombosortase n=1 Tax=Vibrio iocasae TaxID=3098914 RepID=UPI0035D4A654
MNLSLLLFITTIISAILQLPSMQSMAIWNHQLISSGEWWRIVSGNFTHTNLYHLILNAAALWVIAFVFKPTAQSIGIVLITVSAIVGSSLLFTNMGNYAGLSGVLHGVFAYYALMETLEGRRTSILLVLGVITKVAYEQWFGASESTAQLIGARVAVEAHLAGCIAGFAIYLFSMLLRRFSRPSSRS